MLLFCLLDLASSINQVHKSLLFSVNEIAIRLILLCALIFVCVHDGAVLM
jgi:hypothetical protein